MLSNVCEYFPGTYDPYMFICSPWEGRTFNFVSVNQFGGFLGYVSQMGVGGVFL